MSPRLVLAGLPGTGKSSVGNLVAGLMSVPFADSDDLVIEMTGRAVGDIFAADGEAAFRDVEASAILRALLDFDGVLALGGGAVTTPAVRSELRAVGVPVVLLLATQDELLNRVSGTTHRPLLHGDTAARLAELAAERAPLYDAVATDRVETTGRDIDQVAADVIRALTARPL